MKIASLHNFIGTNQILIGLFLILLNGFFAYVNQSISLSKLIGNTFSLLFLYMNYTFMVMGIIIVAYNAYKSTRKHRFKSYLVMPFIYMFIFSGQAQNIDFKFVLLFMAGMVLHLLIRMFKQEDIILSFLVIFFTITQLSGTTMGYLDIISILNNTNISSAFADFKIVLVLFLPTYLLFIGLDILFSSLFVDKIN